MSLSIRDESSIKQELLTFLTMNSSQSSTLANDAVLMILTNQKILEKKLCDVINNHF